MEYRIVSKAGVPTQDENGMTNAAVPVLPSFSTAYLHSDLPLNAAFHR
jgi:hypothetical protein